MGNPITSGNAALEAQVLIALICPTDNGKKTITYANSTWPMGISMTTALPAGKTSYDFIVDARDYTSFNYWRNHPGSTRRIFGQNSCTSPNMIVDGLSNTLAMAERTLEVADGGPAAWGYRGCSMIDRAWPSWMGLRYCRSRPRAVAPHGQVRESVVDSARRLIQPGFCGNPIASD